MYEINGTDILKFDGDAAVLEISTDGPHSHQRFTEDDGRSYPLSADDNEEVYEQHGIIEETEDGRLEAKRCIVLLNGERAVWCLRAANDNQRQRNIGPLTRTNEFVVPSLGSNS